MGVIPIVNENDTIAVTEIKFGDNDTLSAITAGMVHADYLFLMTDVDCLYDKNPRTHPDAQAIEVVEEIGALQADGMYPSPPFNLDVNDVNMMSIVSSAGSALGTGGMSTKIVAARLATSVGVTTVITRSSNPGNIANIITYVQALKITTPPITSQPSTPPPGKSISSASTVVEDPLSRSIASLSLKIEPPLVAPLHTRFIPSAQPIRDRYFWLLHGLAPHGTIYIDSGACRALENKAGLLPVGVVDVEGTFSQYEAVRLVVVERIPKSALSSGGTLSPGGTAAGGGNGVVNGGGKLWEGTGVEVGRALVNYSAAEVARIKGVKSNQIEGLLGYAETEYVALRENISFFKRDSRPVTPSLELKAE
jgi:glutamate 5-kinase